MSAQLEVRCPVCGQQLGAAEDKAGAAQAIAVHSEGCSAALFDLDQLVTSTGSRR